MNNLLFLLWNEKPFFKDSTNVFFNKYTILNESLNKDTNKEKK